jgi:hypothetical protein
MISYELFNETTFKAIPFMPPCWHSLPAAGRRPKKGSFIKQHFIADGF